MRFNSLTLPGVHTDIHQTLAYDYDAPLWLGLKLFQPASGEQTEGNKLLWQGMMSTDSHLPRKKASRRIDGIQQKLMNVAPVRNIISFPP